MSKVDRTAFKDEIEVEEEQKMSVKFSNFGNLS